MIRFVLKSALVLGLAAMVLPLASGNRTSDGAPAVDLFGVAMGIQEAAADFGNFCSRAPRACDAAGELAAFATNRIEAGLAIGYDYLHRNLEDGREPVKQAAAAATTTAMPFAPEPMPDPVLTGAVEPFDPPRPYLPPRPQPARNLAAHPAVAIPTPAPRT